MTNAIAKRPMESVELIVAFSLFCSGIWIVSPAFSTESSAVAQVTESIFATLAIGLLQMFLSLPLLYAVSHLGWPHRQRVRRFVTFSLFNLLLFYGFSQIIIYGLSRVTWLTTFSLALIMGVAHIRLKWEIDG